MLGQCRCIAAGAGSAGRGGSGAESGVAASGACQGPAAATGPHPAPPLHYRRTHRTGESLTRHQPSINTNGFTAPLQ